MREILFRGKWFGNDDWVIGALYSYYDFQRTIVQILTDRTNGIPDAYEVYPETVGQFTGLTDKNGKKIFEGDVVKGLFLFEMEVQSVVTFRDGAFGLLWQRGNVPEFSAFTSICNIEYEVIGNAHDNPELMEVQECR